MSVNLKGLCFCYDNRLLVAICCFSSMSHVHFPKIHNLIVIFWNGFFCRAFVCGLSALLESIRQAQLFFFSPIWYMIMSVGRFVGWSVYSSVGWLYITSFMCFIYYFISIFSTSSANICCFFFFFFFFLLLVICCICGLVISHQNHNISVVSSTIFAVNFALYAPTEKMQMVYFTMNANPKFIHFHVVWYGMAWHSMVWCMVQYVKKTYSEWILCIFFLLFFQTSIVTTNRWIPLNQVEAISHQQ